MFVLADFIEYIDLDFLLFYVGPLLLLSYLAYVVKLSPASMTHDSKSRILQTTLVWFGFGFVMTFFYLMVSIYPAPTDTYIFTYSDKPADWVLIKGIFATLILFVGLYISRMLQNEQVIKRPSFILVIFGFSTLLMTGNYIISAIMNDLQISLEQGGPRALATTVWWILIAIYMLYAGVKLGKKYHSEKLLGLLLLGITLIKVILYDIATMGMQNIIIILMIVGGAMLLFSYRIRAKNMLDTPAE
jgi:CDP-diglyceride synthetase